MIANKDSVSHRISRDHPSLAGHFPEQPIVPGIVILSTLLNDLADEYPSWHFCGIKKLKFLHPLLPEQTFTISYGDIKNKGLRFKCWLVQTNTLATDATAPKVLMAEGHLIVEPARV
ncbi:MAG: hypothetical protein KKF24_11265 [Gammaproteobacteria bacterium]|nr:hypothetical protein [Gammaproteobacteria bacterium]MBU1833263.1 hypothetical protein [Gammaproteobacteria bacterium]